MFNLIPIYPLDGGRAIAALLERFYGKDMARRTVHAISNTSIMIVCVVAIIGTIYLQNIALLAIALYLWGMVVVENRKYRIRARVYQIIKKDRQMQY